MSVGPPEGVLADSAGNKTSDKEVRHIEPPKGKRIGYARISTTDQTLALQLDALDQVGCTRIYKDRGVSGAKIQRPGLDKALGSLKSGDVLVVWKLDRLGRSLPHLIQTLRNLMDRNIGFCSIQDAIDTATAGGRLYFHIMGALAEFETDLISERTKAGMEAARKRGVHIGRPRKLSSSDITQAQFMLREHKGIQTIAGKFNVHPRTIERALNLIKL